MVLIEAAEPEDLDANHVKQSSTATADSCDRKFNNFDKDATSDGFETASDGDIDTDEDDTVNVSSTQREPQEPEIQEQEEKEAMWKGDSCEKIEDAEELRKKAMEKANDAKLEGNKLFVDGKYEEALLQYELALQVAPEMESSVEIRSICHSNRAICFLKLGKYEDTVKECTKSLELNPTYMKSLIRRGEAHEKLQHYEEAVADMKKILELDPSNDQARKSIRHLEPLAEEKREKMKEEMIGKLKEMGNSLLGRFGMSVDNFKAVKDPNSGSYSISFQQ